MSGMDVFAAFCFAVSIWFAYDLGVATERERARERARRAAERAAARNVIDLASRRGRAS